MGPHWEYNKERPHEPADFSLVGDPRSGCLLPLIRFPRYARFGGWMVVAAGLAVFAAWAASLPPLGDYVPGTFRMIPENAVAFVALGFGVLFLGRSPAGRSRAQWARLCGGIAMAAGLTVLLKYLFGLEQPDVRVFPSSGPDQTVLARPGFLTAVNSLVFGLAMLLMDAPSRRAYRPAELLIVAGTFTAFLALLGYACNVSSFYRLHSLFGDTGMSLISAYSFAVLGASLLAARPHYRLVTILSSRTATGKMARCLILTPILVPLATGLIRNLGARYHVYNPSVASWAFAIVNVLLLTGFILWAATGLFRAEQELHEAKGALEQRVAGQSAELSSAEMKFRRLVEQSLVGIYVIQGDSFAYVNPTMSAIFGRTESEMLSRPLMEMIVEEDRPVVRENIRRRIEGTTDAIRYRFRGIRKDGQVVVLEAHGGRAEFEGRPAILGTLLDITERERALRALRESDERYRLLVENSRDLVCEITLDGRFLYVSPNYESIVGYSSSELVDQSVFAHIHPEDVPQLLPKFSLDEATGLYRFQHKRGHWLWLESSGRRFTTSAGELRAVIVTRDVTGKRKLEEQLHQAQKMEAIGTLAGGIAHDFNNILAAILGNAELLQMTLPPGDASQHSAQEILAATSRARDLVRRILTFSRKQDQQRSVTRLQPVIREAVSLLRASLPATIAIETRLDEQCQTVLADPVQIHQVVMNLATNASHAMRAAGGVLRVRLAPFQVDAEFARAHPPLREGSYIRLEVSDTGCGMDAATMGRIFEPFFTTKPLGEGTGLGLSAVLGIMQNHDGLVTVYSEPGRGTTFHLFFPVVAGIESATPSREAAPPGGAGQRVLFVDDERVIGRMAEMMLRKAGFKPFVFQSAGEALAAFRTAPHDFDLIVTDLTMPGMTGLAFAAECLRARPGMPIILATGYSGTDDVKHANGVGVHHLLDKPFSVQTLTKAIRSALEK